MSFSDVFAVAYPASIVGGENIHMSCSEFINLFFNPFDRFEDL